MFFRYYIHSDLSSAIQNLQPHNSVLLRITIEKVNSLHGCKEICHRQITLQPCKELKKEFRTGMCFLNTSVFILIFDVVCGFQSQLFIQYF